MLPELNTQRNQGYATHQAESNEANVPRFGAADAEKRLNTGNTDEVNNLRARSNRLQQSMNNELSSGTGPNKINIVAKKRPPPMNIGFNEDGIELSRQVLYRNFHQINDVVYLVEISRNSKKVFILLFPNFEQPNEFLKEVLTDKQATRLMSECGNIFENFIANFYVKFGKL